MISVWTIVAEEYDFWVNSGWKYEFWLDILLKNMILDSKFEIIGWIEIIG